MNVLRTGSAGDVLHANVESGLSLDIEQAPEFLVQYYGLPKGHAFVKQSSLKEDEAEHIRYRHEIDGNEVIGSYLIGHYRSGLLRSFNGWVAGAEQSNAMMDSAMALQTALAHIGAERYHWQDSTENQMLKEWTGDQDASYLPTPRLVYAPKDLDVEQEYRLCYAMEINAIEPLVRKRVFVDAEQGGIWAEEDLLHVGDVQGTANTRYRGLKTITTDSTAPGSYRLRESGRGNGIMTFNMQQGTSYAAAVDFTDTDNYWNNYNAAQDEIATDAHFGAEMTYDYFWNRFGRNSFDGNGAAIRSYVHYRTNYANAFWNGYVMTYGDGNGTSVTPLTSIDVCGHEVAHAVTTYSAGLIYRYESGALNESFSDIFGNAIEFYADSTYFNWRIGEDILVSGNGIRNMAAPNTHGDPDTYLGLYWHTAPTDNGGVHTNSGVQNYWFYLLCEGGSGTNDNGDNFQVDSIGIHKAEAIAYRNLTVYLGPSSQYEDARYYAIQSAADLFGPCSHEVEATTNAWYAVGVGSEYDSSVVVADFQADTFYCQGSELVQFNNRSLNAKAYQWQFGDGDTSSLVHPNHTYGAQGVFSVTLIAEGCYYGLFDTLVRSNYITIDSTQDICNSVFMPAGGWDTLTACNIFVYDHGGEQDYSNRLRDTLTLIYGPADSAHIVFEEFDYETDYDSVYIHDGYDPSAPIIGAFTGPTLPNLGAPILSTSGAITIRHFSDPYLVGTGFKMHLQAYRDSIRMQRTPDTLACYQQALRLQIWGSGGHIGDHGYWWNDVEGDSILDLNPERDTMIVVKFGDRCLKEFVVDTIRIQVRAPLLLDSMPDTLVCHMQAIDLVANATGGDPTGLTYTWWPFGTVGDTLSRRFSADTTILVVASDGCTPRPDSAMFQVLVRPDITWATPADTILCQGASLPYSITPSGGLGTYSFTDPSGGVETGAIFRDTLYPGAGLSFTHRILISDGCTDGPDTFTYSVAVLDSIQLAPLSDTVICSGGTATLSAQVSGGSGTYTYIWSHGLPDTDRPSLSPSSSTWVHLNVADGCSEHQPEDSLYLKVLPALDVNIQAQDTVCFQELVDLVALPSGGDSTSYSYQWLPSGFTDSAIQLSFTGSANVQLLLQDGCESAEVRDTFQVVARAPLRLQLPADTAICTGQTYVLNALSFGGVPADHLFSWDQGMGLGRTKSLSPTQTTTYTITLSDGCSEAVSEQYTLTINPLPVAQMQITPNPTCTDEVLQFTALDQGVGAQYDWTFGDGGEGSGSPTYHSYSSGGLYDIKLRVTDENRCADSSELASAVEIVDRPVAAFTFDPAVAIFTEPRFQFTNGSQGATSYNWDFGDGGGSSADNPAHAYADTGRYAVQLISYNDLGCADTSLQWVRVKDVFVLHVPNAFSPNGDPVNPVFKIHGRGIQQIEVLVFNRWGEILWESEVLGDSWDGTVRGDLIDAGLYFYQVKGVDFEGNAFAEQGELLILK